MPEPQPVTAEKGLPVHWIGDAPTSLHGNGAASFERTTRDERAVTCRLCLSLLNKREHLTNACTECGDCFHPVVGPNTDGDPCEWCRDCGCHSDKHTHMARVIAAAEPGCSCGHPSDDHVFTGGGFCNVCECQRYAMAPGQGALD